MTTEQEQEWDWKRKAVEEVISYLRDDYALSNIAKVIIESHGSVDSAALELEALAIVAASTRTPYYSFAMKETGIDSSFLGPYLYAHVRYETEIKGNSMIEHIIGYNVYIRFRFVGDYYLPLMEFVFINSNCFRGCAELLVSIIPAGLPARDPLRATRKVVWSAAKELSG